MKITTILTLLLFSTLTNAQTWVRQNPFAELSQLHDIDFDEKYGLAVGAERKIYTTTNSGELWVPRVPPASATDILTAHVVPGTDGQVMFAGGGHVLLKTINGGVTWITSHDEVYDVFKIQTLANGDMIALGTTHGLYSDNQGVLWHLFLYPDMNATAGHFVSKNEGWVSLGGVNDTQIWYTDNGGITWSLRDPLVFLSISSIEMINDLVGFAAAADFVYKTYDGGLSWNPLNTIGADYIRDLHVVNENHLWAALDNGSIYFSTSGGSGWEVLNPNVINSNRTLGIWANEQGEAWAVGKYLSILHSPGFGLPWTDQLPGAKETLFEPHFNNAFVGMVGGSDGAILKTKNGGATWEPIENFPLEENFYGTVMLNDTTVIVGSSSGKVFRSTDQGRTWTQLVENLGSITDLYAINSQIMLLTNENGDIYKTVDGGEIWGRTYDGGLPLYALDFYNASLGWATGINGAILVTTDGGEEWDQQDGGGFHYFSDIHFTSPTEGWLTTSDFSDSIWHTTNGGVIWDKIGLPVKTYWQAVSFMDRDTGWVVGGSDTNGVIYRTNDKGQTWFLDHTSPDPFMGIYTIPNSETSWAVGFGGNIMKFSSCASPPLLTELRGNLEPCVGDTLNYVVEFDDVDVFNWSYPQDWVVLGNTNTASIHFIAGSQPGQVTVQGRDACGDTTAVLTADVFPVVIPEVIISEDNGFLVSNSGLGIYQWFLNGTIIPGAIDPMYMPTVNGTYQLLFTTFTSGCEAYSNLFKFTLIPTLDPDIDQLNVYPNPATDQIFIHPVDGNPIPPDSRITLTNMEGRVVFKGKFGTNQVNVSELVPGFYSLFIQTDKEILLTKIIVE